MIKRDIRNINNIMEADQKAFSLKEQEKKINDDLIKDIKKHLLNEFYKISLSNDDLLEVQEIIIQKKYDVIDNVTSNILNTKIDVIDTIKDFGSPKTGTILKETFKKVNKYQKNYNDTSEIVNGLFYKTLDDFLLDKQKLSKIEKEKLKQNKNDVINYLVSKQEIYYQHFKSLNYNSSNIIRSLNFEEVKSNIIDNCYDILKDYNEIEKLKMYNESYKIIKLKYSENVKIDKHVKNDKSKSIALPWKILLYCKGIKWLFK